MYFDFYTDVELKQLHTKQLLSELNIKRAIPCWEYEFAEEYEQQQYDEYMKKLRDILSTRENILSGKQNRYCCQLMSKHKLTKEQLKQSQYWQDVLNVV